MDDPPIEDEPALLFVFDLADPKLSSLGVSSLRELPICSYINSDIFDGEQIYRVKAESNEVFLIKKESREFNVLPICDRLGNPLPEKGIYLRDMDRSEYPFDEDSYWRNTDDFLGGNTFFRVAGSPLWLDSAREVRCTCGLPMKHVMSIGYERWGGPFRFIEKLPFFVGECALYAFFCSNCYELKIISQSS